MLTEQEVARSWSRFVKGEINGESIAKAEALLDELRPESPLRHRLSGELEELREISLQNQQVRTVGLQKESLTDDDIPRT